MKVSARSQYPFGGYAGLLRVLSKMQVEKRDLTQELLSSIGPGNHTLKIVGAEHTHRGLALILGDSKVEHRDVLSPSSKALADLHAAFPQSGVQELIGRQIKCWLFTPKEGYSVFLVDSGYRLVHDGQEFESDSLRELLEYANQNGWRPVRTRIGRIYPLS